MTLNNVFRIAFIFDFLFTPRSKRPVGYCDHQHLSLSVHPHFLSTQYLINAYLEKGDMLHNYAPWGGQEAY